MSIKFVEEEVARFFLSDEPEVLAIRGPYGIGKTYVWNKLVSEHISAKDIKYKSYSYVSLFGVNSLEDCKKLIFQNTISTQSKDPSSAMSTFNNLIDNVEDFMRKSSAGMAKLKKIFPNIPYLPMFIDLLPDLTIRDSIICFDDFEKLGKNLEAKAVLGLIHQLKEERNCKIVLIFNADDLKDNKIIYEELKEKVIDSDIEFDPLPEESIKIVFDENVKNKNIIKYARHLMIVNIRVLMTIKRLSNILVEMLGGYPSEIIERGEHTLVLA